MRRGPGDMGANVGNKDFGPTGKSGGNVGGSDADEIGDALAESEAAGFTGGGKDDGPTYQEVQAAINAARKSGKSLGVFGPDDYADNQGILGLIGYDQKKSLFENIYDMVVPGRNTPLGAGTALVKGLSIPQQLALGIANTVIGKQMNQPKTPSETAMSDSIIGKDSIVGELANMPQTGIASGRQTPATGYTGRPDDAVAQVTPEVGSVFSVGDKSFIAGVDGPIALSGVPEQEAKSPARSFAESTLRSPDEMYGMLTGQLAQPLSPYTTDYGLTGAPTTNKSGLQQVSGDSYLSQVQSGLQALADNIVSIPGGYMDTKTGLTYSGDYQKNAPARTVTGKQTQGVTPFSLQALQQNLFGG